MQVELDSTILQQALQISAMGLSLFLELAMGLAKLAMSWDPGDCHVWASPLLEFVVTLFARDVVEPMIDYSNSKAIEPGIL